MDSCKMIFFVLIVCCCIDICSSVTNDDFKEELLIKPLPSGHTYFHFQFTTLWNSSIENPQEFNHYRLFPKSLGDVLSTYKVQELHLSQTQGLWHYEKWGYPVEDAPSGAELWVWFQPTVANVDQTWSNLVNAVSGLFCTSLNFLDSKLTISPRWSFRPRGLAPEGYSASSHFVRYGALPGEVVCTENLTPWTKLLPCHTKVGLSTLFNAIKLYDADYHSLAVHTRPVCQGIGCSHTAMELSLSLAVVFDTSTSGYGLQPWSIKKLFGNVLTTQCPLSSSSKVFFDITSQNETRFTVLPQSDMVRQVMRGGDERTYNVYDIGKQTAGGRVLNIAVKTTQKSVYTDISPPPVYAQRYITGYGLERGGVTCLIYNSLSEDMSVIYMDTLPWYMRVFFKSLVIENAGTAIKPFKIHYIPGKDRSRPYQFELVFRLKANSITKISFEFQRAFLKWTEYPPDANHGFAVNSAVISMMLPTAKNYTATPQYSAILESSMTDKSERFFLRIHTESLLVSLPTPDFSMPYNVICLACTVVAIAFGSIHNLTTRKFGVLDPTKKKGLLGRIKSFFRRGDKSSSEDSSVEDKEKTHMKQEDEDKVHNKSLQDIKKEKSS
ncbi:GPI transamidase component PIG-T-like [Gigantopelta aegis]|uniref:GPI transamidase component PIG-T-like n=1 Tax=Gigantopelta aegis TaxID=1735272 RepID=UPI001B889BE9|nr:GPI transamidase component PIG-T-like [Gigantopelta aegis]